MNPVVILFKAGDDLLGRAIKFFTGSPYGHTAIFLAGFTFESTGWQTPGAKWWQFWTYRSGIKISRGELMGGTSLSPLIVPSDSQVELMLEFATDQINDRWWYNGLLLIADALIYPTRWFWNKIGWIPFSSRYLGTVCSTFVDEMFKAAGIDLWPGRSEATTVPGDYVKCPLLKVV